MKVILSHNKRKRMLLSLGVVLFFISLILINQSINTVTSVLWYISALFCSGLGLINSNRSLSVVSIALILLLLLTGTANIIVVGNMTFSKLIFQLLSIPIAILFMNSKINPNVYLIGFWMNVFVILIHFAIYGTTVEVYVNSSNNFISANLLLIISIYYINSDFRHIRPSLLPSIVTFLLSMLALGRNGMLTSCAYLIGLFFIIKLKYDGKTLGKKMIIICIAIIVLAIIALVIVPIILEKMNLGIVEKFQKKGLSSDGRQMIWEEYYKSTQRTNKNLFFGSRISELPIAQSYGNNFHCSYIFIHAYSGLITFFTIIFLCFFDMYLGIKNKQFIYCISFGAIILRGITDRVFWSTMETPIFIFLLLIPFEMQIGRSIFGVKIKTRNTMKRCAYVKLYCRSCNDE